MLLLLEQTLNGLQFGVMLFLLAAGLTLVFGIMGLINLAHGSLYMVGAFTAASTVAASGSFVIGALAGTLAAGVTGLLVELLVLRHLYPRDHLDQVLATFGLILFFNQATVLVWGRAPLGMPLPAGLAGTFELLPGAPYPTYRLLILAAGFTLALALYLLINRTRVGMLIRAGASNREMVQALGVDIGRLYTLLFGLGAALAGLAGALAAPLISVEVGMGENVLILTFVVIVIGGIGSVRGALAGAVLVGVVDTLGRAYLPSLLALLLPPAQAQGIGSALASMSVYLLMAGVLVARPRGLFPAHA